METETTPARAKLRAVPKKGAAKAPAKKARIEKPAAEPTITIDQAELRKNLSFLQAVVEKKNTIPILSSLLIQTDGKNGIVMTGTDLDTFLVCRVPAKIKGKESFCVSAHTLLRAVQVLPDDEEVSIVRNTEGGADLLTVKCGDFSFALPLSEAEGFPESPAFKEPTLKFNAAELRGYIDKVIYAITKEESRYTLSGANLLLDKEQGMKLVTTDGHRLAYLGKKIKTSKKEASVLISKKTLHLLSKLSRDCEEIVYEADDNHLYFECGTRQMISRQLFGQFPNYEMIMPKEAAHSATIDREAFSRALRRVTLFADDRGCAVQLKLTKNRLALHTQSDIGSSDDAFAVRYTGPETVVGFNGEYLKEFLQVVDTEQLTMSFKDANAQALFQGVDDEPEVDFKYVCMPMRI